MSKVFTCGDLHGNYKGFKQALERANFNYNNDTLISLGDLCDGHSDTYEVVEELLKISNKILIRGNHCEIFLDWIDTGINSWNWQQGQLATAKSYMKHLGIKDGYINKPSGGFIVKLNPGDIPQSHIDLFKSQIPYYKDDNKNLFIHGGFNRHLLLKDQPQHVFWWDRDLWSQALSWESMTKGVLDKKPSFRIKEDVKDVFIGHTSTQFWDSNDYMKAANIYNIDTGAGWYGRVCIMNVDTKEVFYSDPASELYPDYKGRQ